MPDFVFLKIEFDKIASEVNSNGFVCFSFGKIIDENIRHQGDVTTERAVVIVESFCWNRSVVKYIFFKLNKGMHTFFSLLIVYSSITLLSPLGLCRRLPIAIFYPCLLVFFRIYSISSSISYIITKILEMCKFE